MYRRFTRHAAIDQRLATRRATIPAAPPFGRRLLPLVPFALIMLITAPIGWPERPDVGDDYVFWSAGRIIDSGGSPLDGSAWLPASQGTPGVTNVISGMSVESLGALWLYPPWTAAMFAPFALLPADIGVPLIHVALWLCTIVAVLLLVRSLRPRSDWTTALALAIGGSFMSLVLAEHVGHFSALLLIGTFLVARGLSGRPLSLIAGAIVLSTKPHLFVVFALVVAAELVPARRWRIGVPAVAAVVAVAAVSFLRYPLPLEHLLTVSAVKLALSQQTTAALIQRLGLPSSLAPAVAALIALVVAIGLAFASTVPSGHRFGDWPLLSRALLVSLIALPYVQAWDDALVLPALLLSLKVVEDARGAGRIAFLVGVVAVAEGAWVAFFAAPILGTQTVLALVPIVVGATLFAALLVAPRIAGSRLTA